MVRLRLRLRLRLRRGRRLRRRLSLRLRRRRRRRRRRRLRLRLRVSVGVGVRARARVEPGEFHTLTILSMPLLKSVPEAVRHRLATVSRWPCIVPRQVPSFQSHTLMMLSTAHE